MHFSLLDNLILVLILAVPVVALAWLIASIVLFIKRDKTDNPNFKKRVISLIIPGFLLLVFVVCTVLYCVYVHKVYGDTSYNEILLQIFGYIFFFGLPVASFLWLVVSLVSYFKRDKKNEKQCRKCKRILITSFVIWLLIIASIAVIELLP